MAFGARAAGGAGGCGGGDFRMIRSSSVGSWDAGGGVDAGVPLMDMVSRRRVEASEDCSVCSESETSSWASFRLDPCCVDSGVMYVGECGAGSQSSG